MAPKAKDGARPGAAAPARLKAKIKIAQSPASGTAADRNGISNSHPKVPTPPPAAPHVQHHPHQPQQGPPPAQIQQLSRPGSIVHQQNPGSPHQQASGQHPGQYGSPHSVPLHQHQSPYPPPAAQGGQYAQVHQYGAYPSPYGTPQSQYSSAETVESMAAAQMHRSFQPSMYGYAPQNNQPPVSSPQSHDAHGRPLYPPQQPMSAMYPGSYPPMGQGVNQVHQSPHGQHAPPPPPQQHQHQHQHQHQGPPSHSLLMSYSQALNQHQQQQSPSHPGMTHSPRTKLEPSVMQRPMDQTLQRPPSTSINTNVAAPPPNSANSLQQNSPGSAGAVNSNAAPGPIPATTPLVVRQDNNGVQWIAFEYSRDRVKMEYTIRCDVESVNTDTLSADFKSENCVYPRACCGKDQYRGNRLQYESECNTVGWALAELNPCLRGKRGLIQRAVDSWRNSNSDPKLRSRRVRRQAKMQSRSKHQVPNHLPGAGIPSSTPGLPPANPPMAAPLQRQPQQMGMNDGSSNIPGIRPGHVFQGGYSTYPPQSLPSSTSTYPTSVPPALHDPHASYSLPQPNAGGPIATSVLGKRSYSEAVESQEVMAGDAARASDLFGGVSPDKRRKFIIVEDGQKGGRVRVRVEMDRVRMSEVPDSYMKNNSVFARAWRPMVAPDVEWEETESQGGAGGRRKSRGRRDERFSAKRMADEKEEAEPDESRPNVGRTMVRVPLLEEETSDDGGAVRLAVPRLTEAKKRRESLLNELGYRMSWAQSRVFAGRVQFLQKSLDAYRNKVRSTILQSSAETGDQEAEAPYVAPHFHTRRGKARYLERKKHIGTKGRED